MNKSSNWEISLQEYDSGNEKIYKVTRRKPFFSIAETKIFNSLKEAKKQVEEWLE
jgi:hypothetical protein